MTGAEILAAIAADPDLQALASVRNDAEIARRLSVGRRRLGHTEIGAGTIVQACRGLPAPNRGGWFLDQVKAIGDADRDVAWMFEPIGRGTFRIDLQDTRTGLQQLAALAPALAPHVEALLALGYVDDPVPVAEVTSALDDANPVTSWTAELLSVGTDGANVVPRVRYTQVANGQTIEESIPGNDLTADALRSWVARRLRLLDARDRALATYSDLPVGPIA